MPRYGSAAHMRLFYATPDNINTLYCLQAWRCQFQQQIATHEMDHAIETAIKAAKTAGNLLKERAGKIKNIDYKGAFNLVTDVDRESEKLIVSILRTEFPEDDILGEEGGAQNSGLSRKRRWLIDPLDGTTNYVHTYPSFCVSIGLEENGQMILGVVYNPMADELFWAERSKGARMNDEVIRVSKVETLAESLLATGFPPDTANSAENNFKQFGELTNLCQGVRRDGSAALDQCFVACGRLDGFWERRLSPWDVAAGSLIVVEAGGTVTNFANGALDLSTGQILATNGKVHSQILGHLSKSKGAV
jgi:myo-inositol-1(or 4)-monophosphatase